MKMLSSKKGFYMSARDWISFFVGFVLFAVGIVPLLKTWRVIPFGLPAPLAGLVAAIFFWIIAVAGVYIIIDGIIEPAGHALHMILLALGVIFVIIGLIPILVNFTILPASFNIKFFSDLVVYNIIITIEGVMLMSAGFTMR